MGGDPEIANADALNLDGVLLMRLSNIECCWRLTERRLRGAWDDGEGVVRGFSASSQGSGSRFARAGLTLCDVTREEPDGGSAKAFFDGLARGLAAIGIDPEEYSKRAAASHLTCRVRKTPIQQMVLSGEHVGSDRWSLTCPRGAPASGREDRSQRHRNRNEFGRVRAPRRKRAAYFCHASPVAARSAGRVDTVRMLLDSGYLSR